MSDWQAMLVFPDDPAVVAPAVELLLQLGALCLRTDQMQRAHTWTHEWEPGQEDVGTDETTESPFIVSTRDLEMEVGRVPVMTPRWGSHCGARCSMARSPRSPGTARTSNGSSTWSQPARHALSRPRSSEWPR